MSFGRVMLEDDMMSFLANIGRRELFVEIGYGQGYPNYLKAVRVSLIALGYDRGWVEEPFRDALDAVYLGSDIPADSRLSKSAKIKVKALRKKVAECGKQIDDMWLQSIAEMLEPAKNN